MDCEEFRLACQALWSASALGPMAPGGGLAGLSDEARDHHGTCAACSRWIGEAGTCEQFREHMRGRWKELERRPDFPISMAGCVAWSHYRRCPACEQWWWDYAEDRRHRERQLLADSPRHGEAPDRDALIEREWRTHRAREADSEREARKLEHGLDLPGCQYEDSAE